MLSKQIKLNKWRKNFIFDVLWLFLSINGRVNFLQLGRFGKFCEQRYRQQFKKRFDFLTFNKDMISSNASKKIIIAFDPSYIPKSGKKTPGLGRYWSGVAGQAKWGLEIGGIAAIDIENHTAFHLEAIQTPDAKSLAKASFNLVDWYAKCITDRLDTLLDLSTYLVADAYFAKRSFVDKIVTASMHVISRLRDDADLQYIHYGPVTGRKGRPKKFDGKIDFSNIDKKYFQLIASEEECNTFCAIVHSKSLKRNIKLVYCEYLENGKKKSHNLYFSTDIQMNGNDILLYYQNRFQIEFLYRDGKQYTGLNDCQARDENKLHFHFNASLSAINVAKIVHWLSLPKDERKAFSMSDIKTINHNTLLIERFISVFGLNPYTCKNTKAVKELLYFGTMAA